MFDLRGKLEATRERITELWLRIPETWRGEIISAFHTFVPAFVGSLALSFEVTQGDWTKETLISLVLSGLFTALRAGFKAVSIRVFGKLLPNTNQGS